MLIHVRLHGEAREFVSEALGLPQGFTDEALLEVLAGELDFAIDPAEVVVDRGEEAIVVRPKAVFG